MTGPQRDAGRAAGPQKPLNARVLIVDDQQQIHDDFREMLAPGETTAESDDLAGVFMDPSGPSSPPPALPSFELLHARSGEEGHAIIREAQERDDPVAVAFVDVRMPPGIDGVATVRRMRMIDRELEVVIMTAYSDKPLTEIIGGMALLHKLLYIRKPFAREEIQQLSLSLVKKWNLERDLAVGRRQLTNSHRRLEAVLDATGDAIAMYDRAERLVFANRWYEALFDVSPDDLRKLPMSAAGERFQERSRQPLQVAGTDDSGGELGVVEPHRSRAGTSGTPLFYRFTQSVSDSGGKRIGDLVVYRDVSRELEIERMKTEVRRLRSELETTYAFSGIIGSSSEMREVGELMRLAAESDVGVLVTGESGTGKELVAKALHFNGARKGGAFVAVNCASVPETLIEAYREISMCVWAACGIPPGIAGGLKSDGTLAREAYRRFVLSAVEPVASMLAEVASEGLEADVRFDFRGLWAHDLQGRASAFQRLVAGGMDLERAVAASGLIAGE